jgi:hypothetical protein
LGGGGEWPVAVGHIVFLWGNTTQHNTRKNNTVDTQ